MVAGSTSNRAAILRTPSVFLAGGDREGALFGELVSVAHEVQQHPAQPHPVGMNDPDNASTRPSALPPRSRPRFLIPLGPCALNRQILSETGPRDETNFVAFHGVSRPAEQSRSVWIHQFLFSRAFVMRGSGGTRSGFHQSACERRR
jgi:hypothetical protein